MEALNAVLEHLPKIGQDAALEHVEESSEALEKKTQKRKSPEGV
jgi:hypothetical protein